MNAVFIGKMSIGSKRHIPQIVKQLFVCSRRGLSTIALNSLYFPPLIYMPIVLLCFGARLGGANL